MRLLRPLALALAGAALVAGTAAPPAARADEETGSLVERVAGPERVTTSVAVSRAYFDSAPAALVASSADFPDALAAAPLAADLGAPLLLTATDHLPEPVADELARLGVERVTLLGGPDAIDGDVAAELADAGHRVARLAGDDRFDTARLAADAVGPSDSVEVVLALGAHPEPGRAWADAVSSGTLAAGADRLPVLLTAHDTLPTATRQALEDLAPDEVVVVGGEAAIDASVVDELAAMGLATERIGERSRFATSVAVAREAADRGGGAGPVVLASGADYPDSLAAGALTGALDGPLLLTATAELPAVVDVYVREHTASGGVVVGGESAASPLAAEQLRAALAGEPRPEPGSDEAAGEGDAAAEDVFEGQASWYGADFHGSQTACGETFDMHAHTAAHRTLPCGTRVRVTHVGNGRDVTVRVNDRGPHAPDRVIDLSRAAAEEIGLRAQGTAHVRGEVLAD